MKNIKALKGFTLIELLVVIAVIGVLAGAIIVAINPVEQLARARDTGRKSSLSQLADSVGGYYATKGGTYPVASATWINSLTTSGDLKSIPAAVTATGYTPCTVAAQNGYCYVQSGNDYAVYTKLEATADKSKCPTPATDSPFYLFSSAQAQSGIVCTTGADPTYTSVFTFRP